MSRDEMRRAWRDLCIQRGIGPGMDAHTYVESMLDAMFDVLADEIDRRLPQEPPK